MMQAIVTKYAGPTNHRGSRVICRAQAGRYTYPWDDALGVAENHRQAAEAFAARFGWLDHSTMAGGAMPDGKGYCFVLTRKPTSGQAKDYDLRGGSDCIKHEVVDGHCLICHERVRTPHTPSY